MLAATYGISERVSQLCGHCRKLVADYNKNEIDNLSGKSISFFSLKELFCNSPFICLFSIKAVAQERFHSAGLLGAAFVRGAAAAGVQDRHELLQLLGN